MIISPDTKAELEALADRIRATAAAAPETPKPEMSPAVATAWQALRKAQQEIQVCGAHQIVNDPEKAMWALERAQREVSRAATALTLAITGMGMDEYCAAMSSKVGGGE